MGMVVTRNDNEIVYGVKELVCDLLTDIQSLPTNYRPGSSAFCLEDFSLWVLGTNKQWKKVFVGSGSGSGSGSGGSGGSGSGSSDLPDGYDYADQDDIDSLF